VTQQRIRWLQKISHPFHLSRPPKSKDPDPVVSPSDFFYNAVYNPFAPCRL